MAIELKQVIEYLGMNPEEIKELDDLKGKFDSEFVRKSAINEDFEPVKKLIGAAYGSFDSDLSNVAKGHEIKVSAIEGWKDAKIKDKVKLLASAIVKSKELQIEELTKKAGQGNDEKVKELTDFLEKEKSKRKDIEALLKNVSTELDTTKQTYESKLKSTKLGTLINSAMAGIKWIDEVTELQTEGFNSIIAKKFKFDLDETGKLQVTDAEGKLIPNTKVTGTFKTADEVLAEEAIRQNLYKINPSTQKKAAPVFNPQAPAASTNQRVVAPRMKLQ